MKDPLRLTTKKDTCEPHQIYQNSIIASQPAPQFGSQSHADLYGPGKNQDERILKPYNSCRSCAEILSKCPYKIKIKARLELYSGAKLLHI